MTLEKPSIVIFDMDGTTVRHVNPKLLHLLEFTDDMIFKFHRFWGRLFRRGDKATIYSEIDRYKARNPMGRVGRPYELANMAAFLMSEEVEYINGEVIAIDGAMGIMGNGTFSNMMAYSDADWQRIRAEIQSTNAADRAKRS